MLENVGIAFLLTLLAGLATTIGGAIAFVVKPDNLKALSVGLGFSAGVMIFLSLTEIIPTASETLSVNFPNSHEWLVYLSFIVGIAIAVLIDYFIPDHIDQEEVLHPDEPTNHHKKIKKAGLFMAIAICVHNFPEGMATFLSTTQSVTLGISVAIAIAIHNIPEGIAVAMPIYHITGKKRYAILYASLSGLSEPLGAFLGIFLLHFLFPQMVLGFLMATVAGIMIYISFDTLLPLAKEYGDWHLSMIGIVTGMLFIWLSLLLL